MLRFFRAGGQGPYGEALLIRSSASSAGRVVSTVLLMFRGLVIGANYSYRLPKTNRMLTMGICLSNSIS